MLQTFKKLDQDMSGNLDIDECDDLANLLLKQREDHDQMTEIDKKNTKEEIFTEMDLDQSGFVSYHELKVYLTRKLIAQNKQ